MGVRFSPSVRRMSDLVTPRLLGGLRDLLPEEMIEQDRIVNAAKAVYESYGFVPVSTPAIEYLDVLSGSAGQEAQQSIFTVTSRKVDGELGLRFDLTVPLARLVAQYQDLPRPFRRYQLAQVWRADKPDKGRFREFTQFDLDSVGTESEVADTEIITGMCDTFDRLGLDRYRVRVSSRAVLDLLLDYAGIPAGQGIDVFRVLDKLEKVGWDRVAAELTTGYKDESGDVIDGVGLDVATVDQIRRYLDIRGDDRTTVIDQLRELFSGLGHAAGPIETLSRISGHLTALGYGDDRVVIDPSIARGLAYYTGPVFEMELIDAPEFGSMFSGGRYDQLVRRFLGEDIPATGASLGVDRLLAALVHLGKVGGRRSMSQVLVTRLDPSLEAEYLAMTYELRRAGISAEYYLGGAGGLGKQLRYADRVGIPVSLLYGSNEHESGAVTLKEMEAGKAIADEVGDREEWLAARPGQREVPRADLVAEVRKLLAEQGRG